MMEYKTCSRPDCEKPTGIPGTALGLCSMHYNRLKRYGDTERGKAGYGRGKLRGTCEIDDCGNPHHSRGWCRMHWTRWRRTGDPIGRGDREVPHYRTIHRQLKEQRGLASNHGCADCGNPAQEWSYNYCDPNPIYWGDENRTYPYSLDLDNYLPRCKKCHRNFDRENAA